MSEKIIILPLDKVYVGSDFHINHKKKFIYESRAFGSIEEHDKFITDSLLKLNENDNLIYLGDFSLNSSIEKTEEILSQVKATVHYLFGNHESYVEKIYKRELNKFWENMCPKEFDLNYSGANVFPFKWKNVIFHGYQKFFKIGGHLVFCSHFPHKNWDLANKGMIHFCGHEHGGDDFLNGHSSYKIMDVGTDNALMHCNSAFFEARFLIEKMNNKNNFFNGHHL